MSDAKTSNGSVSQPPTLIGELFASDVSRQIEEVIKVDQVDEAIVRDEVSEYVITDSIRRRFLAILDRYWETKNKPHEGVGVWVSGFFGSGKSSFAKLLGVAIENRELLGDGAAGLLAERMGDPKAQTLLSSIVEHIPTEAVIFDVSTDRGIMSGNQTLTEIMYRLFLESLGYSKDRDLAQLEIELEAEGRLEEFRAAYAEEFGREWDQDKRVITRGINGASVIAHKLDPKLYPTPDSWHQACLGRADITPGLLAKRCKELMARRRPGKSLVFVVDEVGQFVARDVQKMLDLQAIIQQLGVVGRGEMWLVVTSQERLTELVGGLDDKRVELARLMDRFPQPLQVHLEPSDISEVTSKRVLSKHAAGQKLLRDLFEQHRGRLTENARLTADFRLPELTVDSFADLYPLLPYQIDLIIQVISGLRTQGGAGKHVGGANRTIIKLAQQFLIHPEIGLANEEVGALVRIDHIYDLVRNNIPSDVRGKIDAIASEVQHPRAQAVAKAVCLLQYVRSVHRTAENIAAALLPSVDSDSPLTEVREALDALVKAQKVRQGDDGYRIPTPAEDDWERQRAALSPKPADEARLLAQTMDSLWQPKPSHNLAGIRQFTAGLLLNDRSVAEGDVPFHVALADAGQGDRREELRRRSQQEPRSVFWAVASDPTIDAQLVELHRSREMLSKKERSAATKEEHALIAEEKQRQARHQSELSRLLGRQCLRGTVYFRGNDRSPAEGAESVSRAASAILASVLPEVFERFPEAAARVQKGDLDALLTFDSLKGLPAAFSDLGVLSDQNGHVVLKTDSGPLAEVHSLIESRSSYGEQASGAYLAKHFEDEPFGWGFDVVRLLVVCLLRAGSIEAVSGGEVITTAQSVAARAALSNNQKFRSASFRPKVGLEPKHIIDAADHFKGTFGSEVAELTEGAVAEAITKAIDDREQQVRDAHSLLSSRGLPGAAGLEGALDQMKAARTGTTDNRILSFNASHGVIRDALSRAAHVQKTLTEPALHDIERAQAALGKLWPVLAKELDVPDGLVEGAGDLADLLARENFYTHVAAIGQHATAIEVEYQRRHDEARGARSAAYAKALVELCGTRGWEDLAPEHQERISAPLRRLAEGVADLEESMALIRANTEACPVVLDEAIGAAMRTLEGERLAPLKVSSFFSGGIENEDQLSVAMDRLREECERLLAAGKVIVLQ